jgi:putative ABC transport system permease protein
MKRSLRSWLWRVPLDQEVDEEIAFHIEMRTRELEEKGVDPRIAREMVLARIGDQSRLRRTCTELGRKRDREMRVTQWLEEFRDDMRFAARQLRMSPGFTLVATLTLALGIGANSAIFALADATLIRPLSFAQPDRLAMLWESQPDAARNVVAPYEFVAWSERSHSFELMGAATGASSRATTGADGIGEELDSQLVTARFFDVLGVTPIVGRTFGSQDDRPDSNVVVISEGFWRTRLGGDPNVLGRPIMLDGQPFSVIGVMPAGFQLLSKSDVWTVLNTSFMRSPAGVAHFLRVIGRLAPGTTREQAQAEMDDIAAAIERERPEMNRDRGIAIEPLQEALVGRELRLTSFLLLGVVGFVLLMCCGNVANLLLARTAARRRELAVRSALGAGRRRVVRQLLTESLVLALLGGAAGAAVGVAILKVAPALIPTGLLPAGVTLAFDGRVLAFCAVTAFVVAIAFGAAPARQATGVSLVELMTSGSRISSAHGTGLRRALAVVQVAVSVLLLCGAGLLLRTLLILEDVDSGSRATNVLAMEVSVPFANPGLPNPGPYATEAGRANFYDAVEREVSALAGVKSAAWGSALPLDGRWIAMPAQVEGDPPQPEGLRPLAFYELVSASYFRTLDIPLLFGRHFDGRDVAAGAPVCIVDEAFVRLYLRGRKPIGARVVVRGMNTGGRPLPVREIVGVVAQVRQRPDELEDQPHVYAPLTQDPAPRASLVVQPSAGSAAALAPAIRAAVARIDRERPVASVRTLADIGAQATSRPRFRAVLVGTFAALALVLALVGVFGLIGYSVQQRVREFGVRVALGATRASVIALVLAEARRVVAVGVVIGLVSAAALTRSIGSFLFGVQPLDAVTFVSAAAVLALSAAIASAIPAMRAARVDPVEAFRNE